MNVTHHGSQGYSVMLYVLDMMLASIHVQGISFLYRFRLLSYALLPLTPSSPLQKKKTTGYKNLNLEINIKKHRNLLVCLENVRRLR